MKHIKYYEKNLLNRYWLIPTDERFENSLNKIGCRNLYLLHRKFSTKYIYIGHNEYDNDWGLDMPLDQKYWYDDNGWIYMGPINITDIELDIDKYNL